MKEESKYYVPSIEEFHVGFEYERLERIKGVDVWEKDIFGEDCFSDETIVPRIELESCRVKYLDSIDIEECGFKFSHQDKQGFKWYSTEDYELVFKGVSIAVFKIEDGWEDWRFNGIVKNKSELKRILRQVD